MSPIEKEWASIVRQLMNKISRKKFLTWILPLELKENEREEIKLLASSTFFVAWVQNNFGAIIATTAGRPVAITVDKTVGLRTFSTCLWRKEFAGLVTMEDDNEKRTVTPVCLAEPPPVIEDVLPDRTVSAHVWPSDEMSVARIIDTVAHFSGFSIEELLSRDYIQGAALSRNIAAYLCRHHTDVLLIGLGTAFDGRDHSTIMRGVRSAEQRMKKDPACQEQVNEIWRLLGSPKKVVRKPYRVA